MPGAVVLFLLPALPYTFPFLLGGDHAFVVLSGSMEPAFGPGDYVVIERAAASELAVGDVITFHATPTGGRLYTHRIVEVRETPDMRLFTTKGDANEDPDPNPVRPEQIVGRQIAAVPHYGRLMSLGVSWVGWVGLVALPTALIVQKEARKLVGHLRAGQISAGPSATSVPRAPPARVPAAPRAVPSSAVRARKAGPAPRSPPPSRPFPAHRPATPRAAPLSRSFPAPLATGRPGRGASPRPARAQILAVKEAGRAR